MNPARIRDAIPESHPSAPPRRPGRWRTAPVLTGAAEPSPTVAGASAAAVGVQPRDLYTLAELEKLQDTQDHGA